MKKHVRNGVFGRIVRTLGYIMLLLGSFGLGALIISNYGNLKFFDFLNKVAQPIADWLVKMSPSVGFYLVFGIFVGLILLTFTHHRSKIYRIIVTVFLVYMIFNLPLIGTNHGGLSGSTASHLIITPTWLTNNAAIYNWLSKINGLIPKYAPILEISIMFIAMILVSSVISNRRPRRFYSIVAGSGLSFLVMFIFLIYLPSLVGIFKEPLFDTIINNSIYIYFRASTAVIGLALTSLGSLFGVSTFFRR